jgi:putative addiction module killer protein
MPEPELRLVAYRDAQGHEPFFIWADRLDKHAAAKVTTVLTRIAQGNLADIKAVGSGVFERRIDWGPGYRVYFGRDGDRLVILLGGGTKKRQQRDIDEALQRWADYKQRKVGTESKS